MFPNLKKWAFFYISPHFSPEKNTVINENNTGDCILITVGFGPEAKKDNTIIQTALSLKKQGVQVIELCGGFGPEWITKISHALNNEIPVGGVMYGPEYREKLLHIMKP